MRKTFLLVMTIFILCSTLPGDQLKLLEIKENPGKKNSLLVNLTHAKAITEHFDMTDISGFIELADLEGVPIAKLGKVKKGKIKWSGQTPDGYLKVKVVKSYFPAVLSQVKNKALKPGLRLQATDSTAKLSSDKYKRRYFITTEVKKERYTLAWREITFAHFPDLSVSLKYPVKVEPGSDITQDVSIIVENNGTADAAKFQLDLVLSKDSNIPVQPASPSETFTEDMLLQNGRINVELVKPGESITLHLRNPVKVPLDALPDKYYLGAVADSDNKLKEMDETNNVYSGFMLIAVQAPTRFYVDMPDTKMVYNPNTYELKILCKDTIISDGKDWRKCKIKPYVHQLKHVNWPDFIWEINTLERGIYRVKTTGFCKSGGKTDAELPLKVHVKGGSKTRPPAEIALDLPKTYMLYEPGKANLHVSVHGAEIAHPKLWKMYKAQDHLYRFQHAAWTNFFWEVDTFNKVPSMITGAEFTKDDGKKKKVDLQVRVE